jgi:PAS domain S-box-containing protein
MLSCDTSAHDPLNPGRDEKDFLRHIDRLRESERHFRTLADNMSQLAWTADPRGFVHWYNERWCAYTGASVEAMHALGWRSVLHPEHRERVVARLQHCLATGSIWEDTFPMRGQNGGYNWFLSRALPIRDELGHITHWLGTHTDITAQVRAEEALREFNESLERRVAERTHELAQANELLRIEMAERAQTEEVLRHAQKMDAIGQLTGGIAHDFNNMLTGVLGALELIQRRLASGRISEIGRYMDAAVTSANRAAALTHRLLAFARRQPLSTSPVDVNQMVLSMEELVRRTLGESITLRIDLAESLPMIRTDEHQLENALLNLVINARDAMARGGDMVIRSRPALIARQQGGVTPGSYVQLSVTDTGCGIPPELVERVFDPFFTTKPVGQGTGLGLSMVYGFVKQTGGHVLIGSGEGGGACIQLFLRCPPECDADQDSVEVAQVVAQTGRGERVLVVEDEAAVRMLVVEVLRELGYSTLEACDCDSAIPHLAGSERIDLLITDIGLPGLNGRQLSELARHYRPALGVLFMTGHAHNTEAVEDDLGLDAAMLIKPFNAEALALRVRELLESPARTERLAG